MVTEDIQQLIDDIQRKFSNDPFIFKPLTSMLMGTDFYKAILMHPQCMNLSDEEAESVVKRLMDGEEIELENGMIDKMNSDGIIVRGFFK